MNVTAHGVRRPGQWLVSACMALSLALAACTGWAQDARNASGTAGNAGIAASNAAVVPVAGSQLRFASLPEAREALSAQDIWLDTTSDFQRAATMGVPGAVTPERFREFLAGTAVAWSAQQHERWLKAALTLAPRFEALKIKLPAQVLLVQTNGQDAANAPYTRANTVFLPASFSGQVSDVELLAHELFHIITRNDPALATLLYKELGFESTTQLEWPAEWLPARISNPDAPHSRHFMRIESSGRSYAVMPLLVARRTTLNPGETFFSVLDVRLLAVEPGADGKPTRALRDSEGKLAWQLAARTAPYLKRLGGNTGYIFHPEETAADNFAFLVSGASVPNPDLLKRFEAVLMAPR